MNFVEGELREIDKTSTFVGPGIELAFSTRGVGELLKSELEKPVTLGVRPEDVLLDDDNGTIVGRFRVVDVEPLGDSEILDLEAVDELKDEAGGNTPARLLCKVGARQSRKEGDLLDVRMNSDRLHVFSQTGENLTFLESS